MLGLEEISIVVLCFVNGRIVVILEDKLFIYNFADLQFIASSETFYNPRGICAISSDSGPDMVLATLGDNVGDVRISHLRRKEYQKPPETITAHENAIQQLVLNRDGTLLATASERGTLIRVFDTTTLQMKHEFRRGSQQATIYSLAFNQDSTAICTSSDKGTVHIYNLVAPGNDDSATNKQSRYFY